MWKGSEERRPRKKGWWWWYWWETHVPTSQNIYVRWSLVSSLQKRNWFKMRGRPRGKGRNMFVHSLGVGDLLGFCRRHTKNARIWTMQFSEIDVLAVALWFLKIDTYSPILSFSPSPSPLLPPLLPSLGVFSIGPSLLQWETFQNASWIIF